MLNEESREVAVYIAGYAAYMVKHHCEGCCDKLLFSEKSVGGKYIELLSRGGLKVPSEHLSIYVSHGFAILDASLTLINNSDLPARVDAEHTLKKVLLNDGFVCDQHEAVVCIQSEL